MKEPEQLGAVFASAIKGSFRVKPSRQGFELQGGRISGFRASAVLGCNDLKLFGFIRGSCGFCVRVQDLGFGLVTSGLWFL